MSRPRQIGEVIGRIKTEIPFDWNHAARLVDALNAIERSARYRAPETMFELWERLCDELFAFLPTPAETTWQREIGAIVRGEREPAE